MDTSDIVVGSKWIDDAPGGYGKVTVCSYYVAEGQVYFESSIGAAHFNTSVFRHLFRPMITAPVPDPLAVLVAAEEAFLISRGWVKVDGQWNGRFDRYDHSRKVALEFERGER